MKTLIILAALMTAGAAQAEMVSIKKMKCSLLGNLKIKVNGLERHRSLGTGYLVANVPLFDSCKDALAEVSQTMGRSTQASTIDVDRYITRTEERRNGDRHNPGYVVCHVSETTQLSMQFNRMPELTFKNYTSRHLRTEYGYCRY